jgi:hypothetical protein
MKLRSRGVKPESALVNPITSINFKESFMSSMMTP